MTDAAMTDAALTPVSQPRSNWLRTPPLALELIALFLIGAIIHVLALRFVFPGYLDPLWPHHDDYYEPVGLAIAPVNVWTLLWEWPRPIGYILYRYVGFLGLHGSMAAIIAVVVANGAIAAAFIRRFTATPFSFLFIVAFCGYCFLMFTEPNMYSFYIEDVFAHFSLLLLLVGCFLFWYLDRRGSRFALPVALLFSLAALLTKETYAPTLLVFAFAWFLWELPKRGLIAAAAPGVLVIFSVAVMFWVSQVHGSPFTSGAGNYAMDFTPASLWTEVRRYIDGALNPLTIAILVAIGIFCAAYSRERWLWLLVPLLVVSAVVSWLPNAVLAQHYDPGYSWNGAHLLFLPLVLVAAPWRDFRFDPSGIVLAILMAVAASPLFFVDQYWNAHNVWVLQQEANQRNFVNALDHLAAKRDLPKGSRILITGQSFPYSPFKKPLAFRAMYPAFSHASFDILAYHGVPGKGENGVAYISPTAVDLSSYSEVWGFGDDGDLVLARRVPHKLDKPFLPAVDLTVGDTFLYPELKSIFPKAAQSAPIADQYRRCGVAFIAYGSFDPAIRCLDRGAELEPTNAFAYFFLGQAYEGKGDLEAARANYAKAVAMDDKAKPYPGFQDALDRVGPA